MIESAYLNKIKIMLEDYLPENISIRIDNHDLHLNINNKTVYTTSLYLDGMLDLTFVGGCLEVILNGLQSIIVQTISGAWPMLDSRPADFLVNVINGQLVVTIKQLYGNEEKIIGSIII